MFRVGWENQGVTLHGHQKAFFIHVEKSEGLQSMLLDQYPELAKVVL